MKMSRVRSAPGKTFGGIDADWEFDILTNRKGLKKEDAMLDWMLGCSTS
jgi:hypothetical protein